MILASFHQNLLQSWILNFCLSRTSLPDTRFVTDSKSLPSGRTVCCAFVSAGYLLRFLHLSTGVVLLKSTHEPTGSFNRFDLSLVSMSLFPSKNWFSVSGLVLLAMWYPLISSVGFSPLLAASLLFHLQSCAIPLLLPVAHLLFQN